MALRWRVWTLEKKKKKICFNSEVCPLLSLVTLEQQNLSKLLKSLKSF